MTNTKHLKDSITLSDGIKMNINIFFDNGSFNSDCAKIELTNTDFLKLVYLNFKISLKTIDIKISTTGMLTTDTNRLEQLANEINYIVALKNEIIVNHLNDVRQFAKINNIDLKIS